MRIDWFLRAALEHVVEIPVGKRGNRRPSTSSVALSSDGSCAISGHADGLVRVWNRRDGSVTNTFDGHSWGDVEVALSADGLTALSGCKDGTICLWDLRTGSLVRQFDDEKGAIVSVSLAEDLSLAATNRDASDPLNDCVVLWDVATGRRIRQLVPDEKGAISATMSPAGDVAAVGTQGGKVLLWDLNHGDTRSSIDAHPSAAPYGAAVRFSANGRYLISHGKVGWGGGTLYDNLVSVWETNSRKCVASLSGHVGGVTSAELSADGAIALTTGLDKTVFVWDVFGGSCLGEMGGHAESPSAGLSGNAEYVVTGSYDDPLRFWKLERIT
jgi:WD40 repeat protein